VVTAGTLTEDALLDSRASNWLLAAARAPRGGMAVAAAEVSTGRLEVGAGETLEELVARYGAAELVVPEGMAGAPADAVIRPAATFQAKTGRSRLTGMFGEGPLDGIASAGEAGLGALAGLVDYLDHVGRGRLPFLQPPVPVGAERMTIDPATRDSLEICRSAGGTRAGSLLAAVDRTMTGAGARMLAADLAAPLTGRAAAEARLSLVARFVADGPDRQAVRSALRALPDIGRALGRIAAGRGSPRDLGQLRDGLAGARRLRSLLPTDGVPALLAELLPRLDGHGALTDHLARALVAEPSADASTGGYIAEGYDAALDALRASGGEGRRAIAALEARYRAETGVAALKIRHNNVLGYHIEVPARFADRLMAAESGFTHRQTMAGAVRFNAADLHEQASRVTQAGAHAQVAEAAHLEELFGLALGRAAEIAATADALARIDVAAGLAEQAAVAGWCRPVLVDHGCLEIEGGRHPVVEAAVTTAGGRFVGNDCRLSPDSRLWLVTGPNMGGKSTFLRQNALILLLAQAGSFVPATQATVGMADRIFSRVGASDNLARGRSTFMVEMVETAAILAGATERSFVILDEVGRGTSTYDGLAIAWAVVEAIGERTRCRCLFATHYHELTRLAGTLDGLSLHHVRAREWKGELVLLHELAPGAADRSYGLAVAKLAGLPPPVVQRAKAVLSALEAGRARTGGVAAGLDELPLFAAAMAQEAAAAPDPLKAALAEIDPDALTPREALDALYRLKAVVAED